MQLKITPLNLNPETGEYEPSQNVTYPQLAKGRMRIRVAFLPLNEQQHEMLANLLPQSSARIVNGSADPLLRITRDDEVARLRPGQAPKVHTIGAPLYIDIEIGPRALSADVPQEAAATNAAEGASAWSGSPAAAEAPATPTGAYTQPPAIDPFDPLGMLQNLDDEIS